jgi:hypothetical protein
MKLNFLSTLSFLFLLSFVACDKDDPEVPNEEEVITTLNITLTPEGGGTAVVLSYQDLDGDGSGEPVITGGDLLANQVYNGSLELLNETEDPAEDITVEVAEEDLDHQFFFSSSISDISFSYSDMDADGNPVGLNFTLSTGNAASGTISVNLVHEPIKDASGVSDGDITNAGGESDIDVDLPVNVQ